MLRSVAAVVGGYLNFAVFAALLFQFSRHDPHAPATARFIILSTLYGMCFAALGGFLSARLATTHKFAHAVATACLIAVGAFTSLILVYMKHGSVWSQIAAIVFMAPSAILGGIFASARASKKMETL